MNFRTVVIAGIFTVCCAFPVPVHAQDSVQEAEELDFAQGLLARGMYGMAITQYRKFIAENPHSPSLQDAYLSLGEGYFLSREFNKAVDAFRQFNQLYPHSGKLPVSILRLGQIDIEQKQYDEALKELESVDRKQLKGQILQSFDFYTARAYLDKGDRSSALTFFQKASAVQGASGYTADAFREIGKIEVQGGHDQEALDAYSKSLALAENDSLKGQLHYRIAAVLFLSGQYDGAIKEFNRVIKGYPALGLNEDALANLLLAYFNLGQYGQLLDEYHKYASRIKDDESYFNVHLAAVMAYIELKQYDRANKLLDRMLAFPGLKPWETARIFIKKAGIFISNKDYKDALALLNAYSSADTGNADETFFLKAQCCFGLGEYDKAFNFFENVYQNFPGSRFNKAALLGEAHCREGAGRLKEAQALFLKYYDLESQPDLKGEALYNAIMMDVRTGDIRDAIDRAREYLKTFPKARQYSNVLFILADSLAKDNQPAEAVKLLQGYLASASPQKANTAYFLLGYNLQLSGNSSQALAAYAHVDQNQEGGKFYPAAVKNMAIIYLGMKNFDQARNFFDRLMNLPGPNDLQLATYVWVCNQYLKEQKYDDVLRVAADAEKRFSGLGSRGAGPLDMTEIYYFKAEALRGLGRCDEAAKYYDPVEASSVKNAFTGSAHIGHGLCLETQQRYDEAEKEFQKALDENPDDYTVTAHAAFEMANADRAQGKLDEAAKYYLLVATVYDDDYYCPESLLRAAGIFERQKRRPDALKAYEEILDKYKNSRAASYARQRIGLLK
ncbi:MAG: tetratricopeptide repeat protein [Candidatus Omnitrophica bacterium]|nr:tetratricopeptide repeat protein [Candidatus Omnitrophota bacterium]MDE2008927.1 tetratricopeptide repeat protein [Candidatus Omnitrophota bacterium]MDE2213510.1 tetratricopeptide repeat protein [Candidatus Omnitrophota bacterium]MDE2230589.1 tetratricopeptide repeat protein [Candidatus Omnitrophota bacterium]